MVLNISNDQNMCHHDSSTCAPFTARRRAAAGSRIGSGAPSLAIRGLDEHHRRHHSTRSIALMQARLRYPGLPVVAVRLADST